MRTSWRDRDTAQSDEQLQQRANVDTEPGGTQSGGATEHTAEEGVVTAGSHTDITQRLSNWVVRKSESTDWHSNICSSTSDIVTQMCHSVPQVCLSSSS